MGYGQKYDDYLEDLKSIFKQVFHQTKDDGTLWVIIDTFKRNHNIVPLPFDLTAKLQQVGWLLQDIIIWKNFVNTNPVSITRWDVSFMIRTSNNTNYYNHD